MASEAGEGGGAGAAWKAQFVTAVNAAAGRDLLEKLKFGKARRADPDAQSSLSRASTASRATEASHLKARLGAEKREEVEAAVEARGARAARHLLQAEGGWVKKSIRASVGAA